MVQPLIVICGATASRKSELALGLANRLDGELICCDSVQVYRGFRIGAAGPDDAQLRAAPHHLYGAIAWNEPADAGDYARRADAVIADCRVRNKRPIAVGGAGLYLRALLYGLAEVPRVPAAVRQRLAAELQAAGIAPLFARLQDADPAICQRIEGGAANTQRVLRALEVFEGTGQRLSDLHDAHKPTLRYPVALLAPRFPREVLARRINQRVDRMLASGFVDEVRRLLASGVPRGSRPMGALGYKEISAHLAGELTLNAAAELIKRGHRRYAKRQRTWFKRTPNAIPLDAAAPDFVAQALAALEESVAHISA